MRAIRATNVKDIFTILNYVHDRSFELSRVRFDKTARTVSIPITVVSDEPKDEKKLFFLKTWRNPVVESVLLIRNAHDFTVKDEAEIDQGTINTITSDKGYVTIRCSQPVEIKAGVDHLDLELIMTDKAVSEKTRFALFG